MSWEPLHSGDPFPATRWRVRSYGNKVKRTGELIESQVTLLRKLANGDNWRTDTADAFRDKAKELADKIEDTKDRYVDVGGELVSFADKLDDFESDARTLVTEAREQAQTIQDNPTVTAQPEDDGSPGTLTPGQTAQNRRRSNAQTRLGELQSQFNGIVGSAEAAANASAGRIRGHIDDDVKDSWWDRNAGWLGHLRTALGIIAAIAGIVLLTVATGGTIWLVALGVAIVAGVAALAISIGNLVTGNGGVMDVVIDLVSVLTLGTGGAALRLLGRGFPAVQGMMASVRGSAAFSATMNRFAGIPLKLYSVAASAPRFRIFNPITNWGVRGIVGLSDDAMAAANAAHRATMQSPAVNLVQRLAYGGRESAQMVVQSRQFLDDLARMASPPAHVVDQVTSMVRLGNVATWSSNIGAGTAIADMLRENFWPAQGVKGVQAIVDVIQRVR